ncbi:MAG: polyphenol oxidase family protein [Candidatus Doudnabacteria bacterium]|nr:polyphenol oxidase family protein [Candidatus Doudnabacteria bacterium]
MNIQFKIFKNFPEVRCGLSQKVDGSMGLSSQKMSGNFKTFFRKQGISPDQVVRAGLEHKDRVAKSGPDSAGKTIPHCDALHTTEKNLCLSVTVADCYPIYFFNPENGKVAIAHSGWKGCVSGLLPALVKTLSTNPERLLVGVGPGIGPCHFEIQNDILSEFNNFSSAVSFKDGKIFVDLPKIIRIQLEKAGVLAENIEFFNECTACLPGSYFSYRRDKPKELETMVAYIYL